MRQTHFLLSRRWLGVGSSIPSDLILRNSVLGLLPSSLSAGAWLPPCRRTASLISSVSKAFNVRGLLPRAGMASTSPRNAAESLGRDSEKGHGLIQ